MEWRKKHWILRVGQNVLEVRSVDEAETLLLITNDREAVVIRFTEDAFDCADLLIWAHTDRVECHDF